MDESTTGTLVVVGAAAGFDTIGIGGELALAVELEPGTLLPVRFLLATAALFALSVALAGVALVVGTDAAGAHPLGVGLILVAALSYAVYTTGSRSLLPAVPLRTLVLGMPAGTTACMLAYGALAGGMALPTGHVEWGIVLGLASVGTVAPLLLFYGGLSRLEAGRVGVVSTVEPVVTVLLGAALLGEAITPPVVVGGTLVLAGVVLVRDGTDGG